MKLRDIYDRDILVFEQNYIFVDNKLKETEKIYEWLKDKDCVVAEWKHEATKNHLVLTKFYGKINVFHFSAKDDDDSEVYVKRLREKAIDKIISKGVYLEDKENKVDCIEPTIYKKDVFEKLKMEKVYSKI